MRRWVAIAAGLGLGGALLATWLLARHATGLLVHWRPELERRASEIAGGPVTIGDLSAALFPVAEVVMRDLAAGGEGGATIAGVSMRARWTPLLRGRVEVLGVEIARPQLAVRRDAAGYAVTGVPRGAAAVEEAAQAIRTALREHEALAVLLGLTLERVALRDGTVSYRDEPRRLDLVARELALDTSVIAGPRRVQIPRVSGRAVVGETPVTVDGREILVDLAAGVAALPALDLTIAGEPLQVTARYEAATDVTVVTVGSAGLALAPLQPALTAVLPGVAALSPSGRVVPNLRGTLAADGIPRLDGSLVFTDGGLTTPAGPLAGIGGTLQVTADPEAVHVTTADLALRWRDVPLHASVTADATFTSARIRDAKLGVFGGTATADGSFALDTGRYQLDATAQEIAMAPALAAVAPTLPRVVTGTVRRLTARLGGTVGADATASLRGDGRVEIADGRLAGTNLSKQVFRAIDAVPLVGQAVRDALPPELAAVLAGDDTAMTALRASFAIAGQVVRLSDVALANPAFTVDGGGQITLAGVVDFRGTFRLTPAVTAQLVARVRELRLVVDRDGRVSIPLRVSGPLDHLRVTPELAGLGLSGDAEQLIDRAQDVLRDLFGSRRERRRK